MFNLPWYSWLNVLAIPLVWLLVWTGMRIQKMPPWQFKLSIVGHLAMVAIIFVYWNPAVASMLNPATYLLASLAACTALYIVLSIAFESVKTTYRTLMLFIKPTSETATVAAPAIAASSAATGNPEYVEGIFDIEDDHCTDGEVMQMVNAMTAAFSPNESVLDSSLVQESARDYTDSELLEEPGICNGTLWITTLGLSVFLIAPIWMSWQLLKPLPIFQ